MRKTTIGFWPDSIQTAEVPLAKRVLVRFMCFTVVWTTGLCIAILFTLLIPILILLVGFMFPIAWGLGYLCLLIDISQVTRVMPKGAE
jgi:hypothetical protein